MARNLRVGVQRGLRQSIGGGLGTGDIFTLSPASFDFSRTNTKDSRITFTRASSGTFVGADGLIKTTPVNLIAYGSRLNNWNRYFGASVTADSTTAPDGTLTADKIDLSAGGIAQVTRNISGLTPNKTYTFSFYAKSVTGTGTILVYRPTPTFTFTLTTEWQRFSATITQPAGSTNNSVNFLYIGTGLTEFFVWGVQFEEGSVATDFIDTGGSKSGAPRFDHDPVTGESLGLLIEEARTNLMTRSEQLDEWTKYFNASVTSNSIAAPDGTVTADLVDISAEQFSQILRVFSVQPSTTYTVSFYGRSVTGTEIIELFQHPSRGGSVNFTLTTEWQRFTNTYTTLSTDFSNSVLFTRRAGSTNRFYIWGVQVEEGTFATSYIATDSSTVTRAADVVEITGTNFSSFYNQSEGTIFANLVESINDQTTISQYPYSIDDNSLSNRFTQFISTSGEIQCRIISNNVAANPSALSLSGVSSVKLALAAKAQPDGNIGAFNGSLTVASTSLSMPVVNQMSIGSFLDAKFFNGHIKRLAYFPVRLPNTTLQSITS